MSNRKARAETMTRMSLLLVAALAVVAIMLPSLAVAQSQQLPCWFHGTAKVNDVGAADGVRVYAEIEGDVFSTTVPAAYGNSTYLLKIEPPRGTSYAAGTEILFRIGGHYAAETGTWDSGENKVLNLTVSAPRPTPTPTPTPTATLTPTPTPILPPIPTPTPALTPGGNATQPTPLVTIAPSPSPTIPPTPFLPSFPTPTPTERASESGQWWIVWAIGWAVLVPLIGLLGYIVLKK